jgi:hypothetical protein
MTSAEYELVTTVPFGVRCYPDDPKRLLIPYLDPDIGLERACHLLNLPLETLWHEASAQEAAITRLDQWLRTGPVVLGPLDLGRLPYQEAADTVRGYDHYLVVLGRDSSGVFVVRDPEGFVQVEVGPDILLRAWQAVQVREGRGAFTMRRLRLSDKAASRPAAAILRGVSSLALDNLIASGHDMTAGPDAYRALGELRFDATQRRSLSIQLPAAGYRYLLGASLARFLAANGSGLERLTWARLEQLLSEQAVRLAQVHSHICSSAARPPGLNIAADTEREIMASAIALKDLIGE